MNQQTSSLPIPSQVIETLRSAGHVAVLTGAGVSAEKFTAQSLPSAGALMKENDMPSLFD